MADIPINRIDEIKQMVKDMDPFLTVFFFDGKYHIVIDYLLTEVPAVEAEQLLRKPEYSLWSLGDPPGELPESCPAWICTNIYINCPAGEFLHYVFGAYYKESLVNGITKN